MNVLARTNGLPVRHYLCHIEGLAWQDWTVRDLLWAVHIEIKTRKIP